MSGPLELDLPTQAHNIRLSAHESAQDHFCARSHVPPSALNRTVCDGTGLADDVSAVKADTEDASLLVRSATMSWLRTVLGAVTGWARWCVVRAIS